MTKWIRWSGLIVFVVLIILLSVFYFFTLGPLLKLSLESVGSKALGAKLEVEAVALEVNPLKLVLYKLEATDKKQPMKNVVSFEKAQADLLFLPLLMGKTIIENVVVEGVAFDTDRQSSGALVVPDKVSSPQSHASSNTSVKPDQLDQEATESLSQKVSDKALETLPSADELLAREPLLTVTRGEKMQASIVSHKAHINESKQALPTKADLKKYEKDIKQLVSGKFKSLDDFKARKKAFDQLKATFKADQKAIKAAKKALSDANKDLRQQWPSLQSAPAEDANHIQSTYTLDSAGAQNLTALILGEKVNAYVQQGLGYYDKLSPLLASDQEEEKKIQNENGRFVHFPTDRPLPDFWIKSLRFSLNLEEGEIVVLVKNISRQPDVINQGIRLEANGTNLSNMAAFKLDGILDYRNQQVNNQFDLTLSQWQLDSQPLGLEGLRLAQTLVDVTGQARFDQTSMLAEAKGEFSQAAFTSTASSRFAKEVSQALQNIDSFNMLANVEGPIPSPNIKISSDLDKKLGRAFKLRLKQRQDQLERDLRQKLQTTLATYAGDYQEELAELNLAQTDLDTLSNKVSSLAKTQLSSYQDQLKDEAKAKAKAELEKQKEDLKKKLKSLF